MKRKKNWISLFLIVLIISSISVPVNAKETAVYYAFNTPIFTGTMEEAQTVGYIRSHYTDAGSAINGDGTVSHYTYKYGNDYIKFDFEKRKMTWVDGSKWDITYTGSLDKNYLLSSGLVTYFTDDVVRTFCPEFASTQSLIPAGAPENFSSTLSKFKEQEYKRLGISRDSNTVVNTGSGMESFNTFNAVDYAARYPDVKQAFGMDKQALWNHYINLGKQEGRTALFNDLSFDGNGMESFEFFNAVDYANRYPDVMQAFGTDKQALWNHYINLGKQEGRTALFN